MRLFVLMLLSGLAVGASADTVLRCNLGFGPIAEIKIDTDGSKYLMSILDENGGTTKRVLTNEEVESGNLNFDFQGPYHFFKKDGQWNYEYNGAMRVIGTADCD